MAKESFQPVRSVEKALRILEALNRRAVVKVRSLSEETQIPAPTVVRLLETLVASGYVRKIDRQAGYCVTEKIVTLGAGHHGLPMIFEKAKAAAENYTKKHLWPTAIATLDVDAPVIRFSTIPISPLSHYHSTINQRMTLLEYAHGRAYLSYCPQAERRQLIGLLKQSVETREEAAEIERRAASVVSYTRASGFGERTGNVMPETHSIALPIHMGAKIIGTFGVTYFAKARVDVAALKDGLREAIQACS
ncbi:DNA-binding transcriptional regulator [Chachezhania sediminis]|uniref:DNA-binding transcriptional regulator n=1 Tax=Chachezhania sediminis TaxID=2599291 RepID=UPI00131C3120|nr:DNA-binding transcriptional regulator [Chachezhania sediminis]